MFSRALRSGVIANRRGPGGGSGTLKSASLGLIKGIPISGFAMPGFAMPGLAIPGFVMPGFVMLAFVMPGFAVAKPSWIGAAKLSGIGAAETSSIGNKTGRPVRAKTIG